jgi:hypothetical protein
MADAAVLALELLFDNVVARFTAEGPTATQLFGWRWVAQHHLGPRIVWVPGNPSGSIGRVGPARNPGREPRSLGTLNENFYVVISSHDAAEPENERLQYRATRLLRDYWFRAVYLAARGTFTLDSEEWLINQLERRFGTALRVTGSIQAMLPDVPPDGPETEDAPADTVAEIGVSELNVTETLTVAPDDVP